MRTPLIAPIQAIIDRGGVRDGAGNLSQARWIHLRVDGVPPTVEIRFEPTPIEGQDRRSWLPVGSRALVLAEDGVAGVETTTSPWATR